MLGNQSPDVCIFCNESKIPSGNLKDNLFNCITCSKQFSVNIPIDWKKKLIDSFEPILNASVNESDIYNISLQILKDIFDVNKVGIYLHDTVNSCIRLKKYSAPSFLKSPLIKLYIGTNLLEHPYIQAMMENKRIFVKFSDYEKNPKVQKMLGLISRTVQVNYSFVCPLIQHENKLGIISLDFQSEEEYHKFNDKIGMIDFFIKALCISINNFQIFNKYRSKYNQFHNLHSSGLTLNKLYMNNTQEIIKMTLLSMSGLVETEVNLLTVYDKKSREMTVYKFLKNIFTKEITLESVEETESELYIPHLQTTKPKLMSKNDAPVFKKFGFTGSQILVLPHFELSGLVYSFVLGKNSVRLFSPDEIEILTSYAELAKITIDNSFLYHGIAKQQRLEKEVEIARDIQNNLLPRETPEHPDYEFSGFMLPAREIGGDYYDFLPSPDGSETLVAIGDVSGKGIPAGMVMATARTIIHSIVRKKATLDEIVEELNSYIYNNYQNSVVLRFMTMTLLRIDHRKNEVEFKGGGHGNMLVYRTKYGDVKSIFTGGMVLGISQEIPDSGGVLKVEKGDVILLYTDGVTESMNKKGEQFEEERLIKSLGKNSKKSARQIVLSIYEEIQNHTNNASQNDDITLVAIKRR
jgi:serine phosphatase RsbU (regulator of sigma subunit)